MTHINNKEIAAYTQIKKHRFYNLLFSGKISMKEYLEVLRQIENGSK